LKPLRALSTLKSLATKEGDVQTPGSVASDIYDWRRVYSGWTYLLLQPGKTADDVQRDLNQIAGEHYSVLEGDDSHFKFLVQRMVDITPSRNPHGNEIGPVIEWKFTYLMIALAVAILGTSCFNFTNLSIARSLSRAKR